MAKRAIFVGNSDGIGLAATRRFLGQGWEIAGISRRESELSEPGYRHHVMDVRDPAYLALLDELVAEGPVDLAVYFAGIGEFLDFANMAPELGVVEVNFTGLVKTSSVLLPAMVARGQGSFVGLSSISDGLISAEAPSYCASKAAMSSYLEGLSLAARPRGVFVSNLRFGYVDTKMAKGNLKPFMMSVERAVDHLECCLRRHPRRYTAPWVMIPLVALAGGITRLFKR